MPDAAPTQAPQQQQPDLGSLLTQLNAQVGQLAQNQAAQAQTLQRLAQGTTATAQAVQRAQQPPPPDPDQYTRANDQYLRQLATDPIGLRSAEKQQMAREIMAAMEQRLQATVGETERRRRAEEMERSIYQQNPDLLSEGPFIEFYLTHLNRTPNTANWAINDKITQAIAWARENKAEREQQTLQQYERQRKEMARASTPGGSSFRDPGRGDVETAESAEEGNQKRFELLQGKKAAAMGGGRYAR